MKKIVHKRRPKIIWIGFGEWRGYWFTNLGIHTIAGYLDKNFKDIHQSVWYYDKSDLDNLFNYISENIPDYFCFSVNIGYVDVAVDLSKKIKCFVEKAAHKKIKYIFGNREFLDLNKIDLLLKQIPESLVIQGEGEESVLQIISDDNFENIPNLFYYSENRIHSTLRKRFNSRNHVPPLYTLEIINKIPIRINQTVAYVEVSRGCSKNSACTYCSNSMLSVNNKWELLNLESVISTIEDVSKSNPIVINFVSEDFLGNNNIEIHHFLDQLSRMKTNNIINRQTNFYCALRVSDIYSEKDTEKKNNEKKELLIKMKALGFHTLYVGFESGSNSQLKRYNKDIKINDNIEAIRILNELEINIDGGFITFDPLMSMDEFLENIYFLEEMNVPKLLLFPFNHLIVFPDTTYHKMYINKMKFVDYRVIKLLNIIKYIDDFIPYDLFELLLQKLRLLYFSNINKNKINAFESITRDYGKLTLSFLKKLHNSIIQDSDDNILNILISEFLNHHRSYIENIDLWLKNENYPILNRPEMEEIRNNLP